MDAGLRRPGEGLTAYATFMTPVAPTVKTQKSFILNGGRDRTRTCDLLRVNCTSKPEAGGELWNMWLSISHLPGITVTPSAPFRRVTMASKGGYVTIRVTIL